jgi:hypothetical protein
MKIWSKLGSRQKEQKILPGSDRKWIIVSLIGVIGFLTAGVLFAVINGMSNTWQFLLGINLLIMAGLFKTCKGGLNIKKTSKQKIKPEDNSEYQFSLSEDNAYLK